jgi:hypothetical protein
MDQPAIILSCPTCKQTCRMQRETRPGAKFRCPSCQGMFYFSVHGNGFVELRPADDEPVIGSQLPPRSAEQGETKRTRRILKKRVKHPVGGYHGFDKSRSFLGSFAVFVILGLALVAGSWYISQIETFSKAKPRQGTNAMNLDIVAKRKAWQEKQRRAIEKRKKQAANLQPSGAKVEDGPRPDAKPTTAP